MGKNRELIEGFRNIADEADSLGQEQVVMWLTPEGARKIADVIEAAEEE